MNLSDKNFGLSFEVFPPRSLSASFKLWNTIEQLATLDPSFVSVTYGAGGSTRDITKSAVQVIAKEYGIDVAGHLTCVDASREDVLAVAQNYAESGAKQIVALRGDSPDGTPFQAKPDGFQSSVELIEALAKQGDFKIRVAAYPHPHPDAKTATADIDVLKAKFDAGADSAITQFFFEPEDFLRFRDSAACAGITGKIIPGILPVENWAKTKNFAKRCGALTPDWLDKAYENANTKELHDLLSISICTELCDDLINEGVEDLHFYTLNDPSLTKEVCRALGRCVATPRLTNVA
ncbi:methylenetetrahydrofolate reductase [Amylibacter marinus]|uniref:Methylenetetrahydrofolate reductase n=1 Tax=Amylibacter marinus TaxID=1475483 RepID=A0ABQ5VRX6_9RHOB|nr:methylenetetrahydrofolate reductase [NAD(P)H] [Amylibacter marinus]GLQ33887.1 methylenetetrahydrofolate reductase [Amylibacter marinus]